MKRKVELHPKESKVRIFEIEHVPENIGKQGHSALKPQVLSKPRGLCTKDNEDAGEGAREPCSQITLGTQSLRAGAAPDHGHLLRLLAEHIQPEHPGHGALLPSREDPVIWTRAVGHHSVLGFLRNYSRPVTSAAVCPKQQTRWPRKLALPRCQRWVKGCLPGMQYY